LAAGAGVVVYIGPAYGQSTKEAAPVFVRKMPPGYDLLRRDEFKSVEPVGQVVCAVLNTAQERIVE
jgi:hypothetical protein